MKDIKETGPVRFRREKVKTTEKIFRLPQSLEFDHMHDHFRVVIDKSDKDLEYDNIIITAPMKEYKRQAVADIAINKETAAYLVFILKTHFKIP